MDRFTGAVAQLDASQLVKSTGDYHTSRMEPETPFVRAQCRVELNSVTPVNLNLV